MRKITEQATTAFFNNQNYKNSNTQVISDGVYTELRLHDNIIAYRTNHGIFVSNAGWKTNTTKERLNGILNRLEKRLYQAKGQWFIMDHEEIIPTAFPTKGFLRVWND